VTTVTENSFSKSVSYIAMQRFISSDSAIHNIISLCHYNNYYIAILLYYYILLWYFSRKSSIKTEDYTSSKSTQVTHY